MATAWKLPTSHLRAAGSAQGPSKMPSKVLPALQNLLGLCLQGPTKEITGLFLSGNPGPLGWSANPDKGYQSPN